MSCHLFTLSLLSTWNKGKTQEKTANIESQNKTSQKHLMLLYLQFYTQHYEHISVCTEKVVRSDIQPYLQINWCSKGEAWRTILREIGLHLVLHQSVPHPSPLVADCFVLALATTAALCHTHTLPTAYCNKAVADSRSHACLACLLYRACIQIPLACVSAASTL